MVKRFLTLIAGSGGRVAFSALAITLTTATALGHGGAILAAVVGGLTLAAGYAVTAGALLFAANAFGAFEEGPPPVAEAED